MKKKLHIAIKNKTKLTKELESIHDITYFEKPNFLSKIGLKKKTFPDIYFHQGGIKSKETKDLINNSKLVIVNSNGMREMILENFPEIESKKIHILYPYIQKGIDYDTGIKEDFRKKYMVDENTRLIFLSAKDLNSAGIKTLFKIASNLEEKNFKLMVESDSKSIEQVKMQLNRLKVPFQVILLENHENKDELFIASDIFVFPTKQKLYSSNILKAMYYKNAVFAPSSNFTSEIIDAFSIMNGTDDGSTPFKIDALLSNPTELEQIQNLNHASSLNFDFDSRMNIIKSIIENNL